MKHLSFSCTTLLVLWYSRLGPSCSYKFWKKNLILQKRALRLIHFKPFRLPAVPLLNLSNVLPLNFRYFKTICLIMHDILKNVSPPNVSNSFTYSSKVHHHNTRFSAAGNFYIKHSRTNHMKNSFSRIGVKISNSIPDSDRALPKYKFKNTLQSRLLDILIQEDTYVGVRTLIDIFVNINFFSLISLIPCFIYLY